MFHGLVGPLLKNIIFSIQNKVLLPNKEIKAFLFFKPFPKGKDEISHTFCPRGVSISSTFFLILSAAGPAVASAQKCPPSAAPNVKNVKQMLLDWCRAKTEPYEVNMAPLCL